MAGKGEKNGDVTSKQVMFLSLLPSGRAIRFLKLDTQRMLEATERSAIGVDGESKTAAAIALSKEIVATCLRGVSRRKLELKFKSEKTADDKEIAVVDVDATLKPAVEAEDGFWIDLGYGELTADGPNSMFKLFPEMDDWKALQQRFQAAGGGSKIDPFVGKVLMLTV